MAALAELVDEEVAQRPELGLPALVAELRVRADSRHPPVVQGVTWFRCTPPRASNGTRCSSSDWSTGTLPISHALAHGPEARPSGGTAPALRQNHWARVHLELSVGVVPIAGRPSVAASVAVSQRDRTAGRPRSGAGEVASSAGETKRCRVCNAVLTSAPSIMLRRCETCSVDVDDVLLAELKRVATSQDHRR